jgi:hypothetical protein
MRRTARLLWPPRAAPGSDGHGEDPAEGGGETDDSETTEDDPKDGDYNSSSEYD